MGLIGAGAFQGIIDLYRLLWIGGRPGGFKTSLAFYLARTYLANGYRLVTNCRSPWADEIAAIEPHPDGALRAIVLLDEGGLHFKSSRQVEEIASYSRKMDLIYVISSFWPPARAAQVVTVQPIFNLMGTGLPLVVYKWKVRLGSFEDKGTFLWWDPASIYGVYSTLDPGGGAGKIVSWLVDQKEAYKKRYGRDDDITDYGQAANGISVLDGDVSGGSKAGLVDIFADSVAEMAEAAERIASVPSRRRKIGRF